MNEDSSRYILFIKTLSVVNKMTFTAPFGFSNSLSNMWLFVAASVVSIQACEAYCRYNCGGFSGWYLWFTGLMVLIFCCGCICTYFTRRRLVTRQNQQAQAQVIQAPVYYIPDPNNPNPHNIDGGTTNPWWNNKQTAFPPPPSYEASMAQQPVPPTSPQQPTYPVQGTVYPATAIQPPNLPEQPHLGAENSAAGVHSGNDSQPTVPGGSEGGRTGDIPPPTYTIAVRDHRVASPIEVARYT